MGLLSAEMEEKREKQVNKLTPLKARYKGSTSIFLNPPPPQIFLEELKRTR